jgi:hypothetical protein
MSYPTDHMVIIIISITRSSPLNVRKKTDLGNASKYDIAQTIVAKIITAMKPEICAPLREKIYAEKHMHALPIMDKIVVPTGIFLLLKILSRGNVRFWMF